jgi:hypothetical protein
VLACTAGIPPISSNGQPAILCIYIRAQRILVPFPGPSRLCSPSRIGVRTRSSSSRSAPRGTACTGGSRAAREGSLTRRAPCARRLPPPAPARLPRAAPASPRRAGRRRTSLCLRAPACAVPAPERRRRAWRGGHGWRRPRGAGGGRGAGRRGASRTAGGSAGSPASRIAGSVRYEFYCT